MESNRQNRLYTEEEIQFIRDNARKMTFAEIAERLGRSPKSVNLKAHRLGINGGTYTKEKHDFIEEHAGGHTVQWIAKELGRPFHSLRARMFSLGIGSLHFELGSHSASGLSEIIGVSYETIRRWILTKGLPATKRSKYKGVKKQNMHYHILAEDFWKWAAKNKELVPFYKIEKDALPPEPDWVEEERRKQFNQPAKQKVWSSGEDDRLWHLYYSGMKQKDISVEMGRTRSSIEKRLKRLREIRL